MLDAVTESFRIRDAHVHHRLFVCTNAREQRVNTAGLTTVVNITTGSERLAASGWTVTGVVSQSDVIKVLHDNAAALGDGAKQSVDALGLTAVRFVACVVICLPLGVSCVVHFAASRHVLHCAPTAPLAPSSHAPPPRHKNCARSPHPPSPSLHPMYRRALAGRRVHRARHDVGARGVWPDGDRPQVVPRRHRPQDGCVCVFCVSIVCHVRTVCCACLCDQRPFCAIPDRPCASLAPNVATANNIPTKPKTGALISNLSASDLRGLAADEFAQLLLPVGEYILVRHGLAPAPAAGADWAAALKALPVVTVTESTTFTELLALLVAKHLHRVYVVNCDGKPISIITLTDVLRAVTK